MEPRRDDGDDAHDAPPTAASSWAAMEPRRDDGDDDLLGDGQIPSGQPQWSPVVTTGTTRSS
mgnify:CR=1 FL=1